MKLRVFSLLLLGVLLSGCALTRGGPLNGSVTPFALPTTDIATQPPTETLVPTATVTVTPTPDYVSVGLPAEQTSNLALDFVSQMCSAEWFNRGQQLPCPGNDSQENAGYVMQLVDSEVQGFPSNLGILLTFPPSNNFGTLFSKYPPFTVKTGDRFRAVLACRAHTFCDVEFGLEYYDDHGKTGLKHWRYLFADPPVVVDYPLDGVAGKTVRFSLTVMANGNPSDADAVWIAPHIYRPAP